MAKPKWPWLATFRRRASGCLKKENPIGNRFRPRNAKRARLMGPSRPAFGLRLRCGKFLCRIRRRIDESDNNGLEVRTTGRGVPGNLFTGKKLRMTALDKAFIDEP